ncbi:MAG TPA: S-methyl-5-thioribose-1-phosphate isomerase [Bacillota bacterium]
MIRPHRWDGRALHLIEQRRLPGEEVWVACRSAQQVADAIRDMVVRGAPAIGVAAAYGLALEARRLVEEEGAAGGDDLVRGLEAAAGALVAARPTAVNLAWAVERMRRLWRDAGAAGLAPAALVERLAGEAEAVDAEDVAMNRAIARHGRPLLAGLQGVLTHCNTGGLATAGVGTALGVIAAAAAEGGLHVYATETRPYLQGARLTAWELLRQGIPATLITDGAAGYLMKAGRVQAVITGADRIAANGDVANKIGTYTLAVLARAHQIPFYVAAPRSTIDLATPSGEDIEIELRSPTEVTHWQGRPVAPEGMNALNPAFDVTPAALVTAVVTDAGVARPPYQESLRALMDARPALSGAGQAVVGNGGGSHA